MVAFARDKRGFISYLGLILAMAIVCYLVYILLNTYLKQASPDKKIGDVLTRQGIDTSSYQSIKESVRKQVEDINRKRMRQEEEINRLSSP